MGVNSIPPIKATLVLASTVITWGAQPVIPPNLYSMFMNIIAWGPQVNFQRLRRNCLQDETADQRRYLYLIFSSVGFVFVK